MSAVNHLYELVEKQDIATKSDLDTLLLANKSDLERLFENGAILEDDPEYRLCKAVLNRRIGERLTRPKTERKEFLLAAIELLSQLVCSSLEKSFIDKCRPELSLSYLRMFEVVSEDVYFLEEAEKALVGADNVHSLVGPNDAYSKLTDPIALNALGNIYKQYLRTEIGDSIHYLLAIESYTKAEDVWKEDTHGYQWAMLQKNKAESLLLNVRRLSRKDMSISVKRFLLSMLDEARRKIIASLAYRSKEEAPYQYAKSMSVLRDIENEARGVIKA